MLSEADVNVVVPADVVAVVAKQGRGRFVSAFGCMEVVVGLVNDLARMS
jgi:hypothetical protein